MNNSCIRFASYLQIPCLTFADVGVGICKCCSKDLQMFGGGFANVKHYREGKVRYYLSFGRAKYRVPDLPRRVWALRLSMKALKVRSWPAGIDVCLSISLLLFYVTNVLLFSK